MTKNPAALLGLTGLALFGLAACNGTTTNPGTGTGPTASQVTEVGYASEDEVDADISSINLSNVYSPIGFDGSSAIVRGPAAFNPPACITANPANPTDADADGIPDDVTLTFNCSISAGRFTLARTGTMRIQDTNQDNGFDASQTLTDFAWSLTDHTGDRTFSATRNGTRARAGTNLAAALTVDMNIVRVRPNHPDATIQRAGTVSFTAAAGDSLFVDQPLPSGTINVTGSQSWHRGDESYSFVITTQVPLAYDATCTTTDQRISSGELWFTGMVGGQSGYLKLTWTACGVAPTRTWVATATS
ncbi:MAG: hypothetical protein ABJC74_07415 [Gemmatimonadota bacterium]